MRLRGCRRCKRKHLKCDLRRLNAEPTETRRRQGCTNCTQANEQCLPPLNHVRIRTVHSVIEQPRSADQTAKEICFVYEPDHEWVRFSTPVRFANGEGNEEFSANGEADTPLGNNQRKGSASPDRRQTSIHGSRRFSTSPGPRTPPVQYASGTPRVSVATPASNAVLHQSTALWPLQNRAEAELLQYFIERIGPQLDATDSLAHFTTLVPQLAAHSPLLLYAIVATASVHRNRLTGLPDDFSEDYHAKCVRILLRFLNDSDYRPDETFLASIVVLRKCEEMSDEDRMCHLLGSSRIINSIGAVASNGGLGEAAAWLALRQSIYVCLTSNTELNLNLTSYRASSAFLGMTDHAWANRSVYIFAEAINFSGSTFSDADTKSEAWHSVQQSSLAWYQGKPDTFLPIFEDNSEARMRDEGHQFPVVYMLQAPHVIGLMYYHLTRIILALHEPVALESPVVTSPQVHTDFPGQTSPLTRPRTVSSANPFNNLLSWRSTEARIRQHVKICVGLALSNPHVVAANFEASHILLTCGHCLSSETERKAAVKFLQNVPPKLGWSTHHIIENLERYWQGT